MKNLLMSFAWVTFYSAISLPSWAAVTSDFVRQNGQQLVVGPTNSPIFLRGMNFQNDLLHSPDWSIWTRDPSDPTFQPITIWYSETHVQEISSIGFNTIRFNMNYRLFEDDASPGVYKSTAWNFIDQYVQWAKNHNLYLILDMHVPQGGLQTTPQAAALWDVPANQNRLKALWKAIAQRYANEPVIAGYDLVNEPSPTNTTGQWQQLAQGIIDEIRLVDTNHLVIVEQVKWLIRSDGSSPIVGDLDQALLNSFQITVTDSNLMYDFHFYSPMEAHQASGFWRLCGGGVQYPAVGINEATIDGLAMPCDINFLEHQLLLFTNWGVANNVPLNIGEWAGAIASGSIFDNVGGFTYVADMLDLFKAHGLSWQSYSNNELYSDGPMTNLLADRRAVFADSFSVPAPPPPPNVRAAGPLTLALCATFICAVGLLIIRRRAQIK